MPWKTSVKRLFGMTSPSERSNPRLTLDGNLNLSPLSPSFVPFIKYDFPSIIIVSFSVISNVLKASAGTLKISVSFSKALSMVYGPLTEMVCWLWSDGA